MNRAQEKFDEMRERVDFVPRKEYEALRAEVDALRTRVAAMETKHAGAHGHAHGEEGGPQDASFRVDIE